VLEGAFRNNFNRAIAVIPVAGEVTVVGAQPDVLWGAARGLPTVDLFDAGAILVWLANNRPTEGSLAIDERAARVTSVDGRPDLFDAGAILTWIAGGGVASVGMDPPDGWGG
jgi:hypothetical protein